jgi:hypothetical protein
MVTGAPSVPWTGSVRPNGDRDGRHERSSHLVRLPPSDRPWPRTMSGRPPTLPPSGQSIPRRPLDDTSAATNGRDAALERAGRDVILLAGWLRPEDRKAPRRDHGAFRARRARSRRRPPHLAPAVPTRRTRAPCAAANWNRAPSRGQALDCKKPCISRAFCIGETGFEPATARPPAGCATRLRHSPWCSELRAGDGNRTRPKSLEGSCATTTLRPRSSCEAYLSAAAPGTPAATANGCRRQAYTRRVPAARDVRRG